MRMKTEWTTEKDNNGKNRPVRIGLCPEQGKGIEYEFDLLMQLNTDHVGQVIKDRTGKFQDQLIEKPGEDFGNALANWLKDDSSLVKPSTSTTLILENDTQDNAKKEPVPGKKRGRKPKTSKTEADSGKKPVVKSEKKISKPLFKITSKIHKDLENLLIDHKQIFTPTHYEWVIKQVENEPTEEKAISLLNHVNEVIKSSMEKAAWAGRKVLDARSRIEDRLTKAEEFPKRINLWVERANVDDLKTMEYMESAIEPFALDEVLKQKKSKTLKMAGINISFRKTYNSVSIENKTLAIDFCRTNHPHAVETTEILQEDKLLSLVNAGSVLPGVRLVAGADKMHIIDQKSKVLSEVGTEPEIDF